MDKEKREKEGSAWAVKITNQGSLSSNRNMSQGGEVKYKNEMTGVSILLEIKSKRHMAHLWHVPFLRKLFSF